MEHRKTSPAVKRAIRERVLQDGDYSKVLTETKVRKMKIELNRTLILSTMMAA